MVCSYLIDLHTVIPQGWWGIFFFISEAKKLSDNVQITHLITDKGSDLLMFLPLAVTPPPPPTHQFVYMGRSAPFQCSGAAL